MASYLPCTLSSSLSLSSLSLSPSTTNHPPTTSFTPIRCGPRSTRGPLLKGRTLSSEAILAVQSLKRHHRSNGPNPSSSFSLLLLSRLIKSDLVAAFTELLRQDRPLLALIAFSALRSDHSLDPTAYADLISALGRHKMWDDIDRLIVDIEGSDCLREGRKRGMVRVVKAVVGAGRGESTVRIYRMMKRGGWGSGDPTDEDEYLGRVFERAFRRFGEDELAEEVDDLFRVWFKGKTDGF